MTNIPDFLRGYAPDSYWIIRTVAPFIMAKTRLCNNGGLRLDCWPYNLYEEYTSEVIRDYLIEMMPLCGFFYDKPFAVPENWAFTFQKRKCPARFLGVYGEDYCWKGILHTVYPICIAPVDSEKKAIGIPVFFDTCAGLDPEDIGMLLCKMAEWYIYEWFEFEPDNE